MARFSGSLKGVYGETGDEIDEYIRRERESWQTDEEKQPTSAP